MILMLTASADYDLPGETFLRLMVEPCLTGENHAVQHENLRTSHTSFAALDTDSYGNPVRRFRTTRGRFSYDFTATIETTKPASVPDDATADPAETLPADLLLCTLPSRHADADRLTRLAYTEFGSLRTEGARVNAIAHWVKSHCAWNVERVPFGAYGVYGMMHASASETLLKRQGTCDELTHAFIALCRAFRIPARFVSGYCLGLETPDFHAWAQVYLSGKWHHVDVTAPQTVRSAMIPIACGRDGSEVAPLVLHGAGTCRECLVRVRDVTQEVAFDVTTNANAAFIG